MAMGYDTLIYSWSIYKKHCVHYIIDSATDTLIYSWSIYKKHCVHYSRTSIIRPSIIRPSIIRNLDYPAWKFSKKKYIL